VADQTTTDAARGCANVTSLLLGDLWEAGLFSDLGIPSARLSASDSAYVSNLLGALDARELPVSRSG